MNHPALGAKMSRLRKALHRAPFYPVSLPYRGKVTNKLQDLLEANTNPPIPSDILEDAKYLSRKWLADDFSSDLLRGIDKSVRYKDGGSSAKSKRVTSSSITPNYPWRRNCQVPGDNRLVLGQCNEGWRPWFPGRRHRWGS